MEENRNIRQEIAECEKLLIGLGEEWKAELVPDIANVYEKLAELTREVRELNDFARRTPVLEEHLRGVDRRLEKLERSSLSEHRVPS